MTARTDRPTQYAGLRAATLLATIAATGTTAQADIAYADYIDEDTFAYIVQDMPDFDQRRSTLPNTGQCYCGPASTIDLLGYVATHGYPDVDPGIPLVSWHTSPSYDTISDLMASIGASTGTDPGGPGTDCGVGQAALYDELVARIGDRFTVRNCYRDYSALYAPDTAEIAFRGVHDQAVGLALWGRWTGEFIDEIWVPSTRRGGHFEAVTRAVAGGGIRKLGLRDPDDDDIDLTTQSEFSTSWFDVTRRASVINGNLLAVDQLNDPYTVGGELRVRHLEGYLNISPKACYTWDEVTESLLRIVPAIDLWSARGMEVESMTMPGTPSRVAFGPSDLGLASIIGDKIVKSDRTAGPRHRHRTLHVADPNQPAPADLAFDARRRLHVVQGDRLLTIDWDREEISGEVRLPGEGTSIAIENDIVHVLVPEMELVVAINDGPNGPFTVELPLPSDAVVQADSTITMLPGGRLFLLSDGRVNPMRITDGGFARMWVPVPRDGDWAFLSADDNDMLCMIDRQGRVEAYRFTPDGFQRNLQHAMEGVRTAGGLFAVASSTSNLTPELEAQAWIGSEDDFDDRAIELDCPGDLNFDGRVDSADMGLLLGMWGEDRSIADLDRNGTVDSADLGLLLSHFGDCP